MVARRNLTPSLGDQLKKFARDGRKTDTRPHGHKIMGPGSSLELFDPTSGELKVRISPDGSQFTGVIRITSDEGFIEGYDTTGTQTVSIDGTNNLMVGDFRSAPDGSSGVILTNINDTGLAEDTSPTIFLSNNGQKDMSQAHIRVGTTSGDMFIKPRSEVGGVGTTRLQGNVLVENQLEVVGVMNMSGTGETGIFSTGANLNLSGNSASLKATSGHAYVQAVDSIAFKTIGSAGYDPTSSSSANVVMTTEGFIRRSTSSLRYKTDVEDYVPDPAWLDIPTRRWRDKAAIARAAEITDATPRPLTAEQQADLDAAQQWHVGRIAEEAVAAAPDQVTLDHAGNPDAYEYDRDGAVLAHFVRQQRDQIAALEAQVKALADRVTALENAA